VAFSTVQDIQSSACERFIYVAARNLRAEKKMRICYWAFIEFIYGFNCFNSFCVGQNFFLVLHILNSFTFSAARRDNFETQPLHPLALGRLQRRHE